jgi:hypothetical protein
MGGVLSEDSQPSFSKTVSRTGSVFAFSESAYLG